MYTNVHSQIDKLKLIEKLGKTFKQQNIESWEPEPEPSLIDQVKEMLENNKIDDKLSHVEDKTFGPKLKDGKWMFGQLPLETDEHKIKIGSMVVDATPGLWDLILKTNPKNILDEDRQTYKEIMQHSNNLYRNDGKPKVKTSTKMKAIFGAGLFTNSEIIDRIVLLSQSQKAGNTSYLVENERQDLLRLLYEREIIDKTFYKSLI